MKNRIPRKLKKAIKSTIIIYDVAACYDLQEVMDIYNRKGVLLYSSKKGNAPHIISKSKYLSIVDSDKIK